MPLLDPEIAAAIGTLRWLDDAFAFRLGRLDQPCLDCVPQRRCIVHSYDQRLVERYQARYAAAFSDALARLEPDAIVQAMRPGNGVRPAPALLATAVLTRLQEAADGGPVAAESES